MILRAISLRDVDLPAIQIKMTLGAEVRRKISYQSQDKMGKNAEDRTSGTSTFTCIKIKRLVPDGKKKPIPELSKETENQT